MDDRGSTVATPPDRSKAEASQAGPRAAHVGNRVWIVATLVAVLGGTAGAFYFSGGGQKSAEHGGGQSAEHKSSPGLPVEVTHPRRGGIQRTTTQAGSVHAFKHASLYAKISGYLKVQNVDIGDRVRQGDLLAVIDDPEVDKAVEQNQAALDQANAKVRVAEAKVRSAEASRRASAALVKQAEAMVAAKVSNEDLQRKQLERIHGLVLRNAVEAKLEDEQKDRFDVSASDVGVARAEVISSQAEEMNKAALVEEAQADLLEARANVKVAQANLAKARVMQEYTRMTSPYDGVITLRSFHPGDFIRSASEGGNTPVLAVAVTDKMRVVLPVPDTEVPYLDVGDQAVLQIVALPGETFTGTIARFSGTEDPESRNMRTEIDLPNTDGKLREGMYGRVAVILKPAAPNSLTIPSSGLLNQSGKGEGGVFVARDGRARKVEVRVGNDNGVEAEILGGLSPDDLVITSYNGSLAEGTPVKAEERKAAPEGH